MTEHYYKQEDTQKIATEVDLNAFAYSQKFSWLFSVFIKFDLEDKVQEKYEEFLDTKASIIQSIELDEAAKYVGSRVVDGWTELYFYARDSKALGSKVSSILTSLDYPYEANVVRDSKWDFYNYNLYPTELESHHIQSRHVLEMLIDEDDDLHVSRPVEHYVYFDTPTQKERFVQNLSLDGFEYKDEIDSEEFQNGIALVKTHDLLPETIDKVVEEVYESLQKDHGYYEGWSTTLAADIEE
ncbi:DUF695 domain-containing protein [Sulfurimonas sp. C5]|uniref:DUF695 domain-containing protein n=1 Tax=Sulfurimonas sp. C5 TaxID=3036947 RepID=UPI00245722CB|nr:DUF695 domain-containing protein [Sulfurimonas sp. C5]MDH4944060.1 DUF695 domain-containing protein [Sulfurimonas sp. C5]